MGHDNCFPDVAVAEGYVQRQSRREINDVFSRLEPILKVYDRCAIGRSLRQLLRT